MRHSPLHPVWGTELVCQVQGNVLTPKARQDRASVTLKAGQCVVMCGSNVWFQRKATDGFQKSLLLKERPQVSKGGNSGCLA